MAPNLMPENDRLLRSSNGLSEVEVASCRDGELLKQIAGDVLSSSAAAAVSLPHIASRR